MLTDVSSESVSAILPLYITGFLGLSIIAFGIIDGINQGASAIVRIAAGYASDRIGRPKRVALAGYGLSAVARAGLLFAGGFWALTAVVTADRIGKGIRTAPRDALIAVSAQPEYLARHFGVHRMLDNIGAASGPLLAFFILMMMPTGYTTVFVVSLAFAAVGVAVLTLLVPNLRTRTPGGLAEERRTGPVWGFRWRLLREPGLGRLLAAAGILGLLTVGDGFIYLVLQDRDSFAVQWFPLLYVGTNVVFLALAVPLGRLADRWGKARVFIAGHVALLACYLLAAAPIGGLGSTVACLVLLGAFYAATDGVLAALASQLTPPDMLATGLGAAQTVVALSRMAASVGFGVLWFALGPSGAMVVVGGSLAAAIVASWFVLRGGKRQRPAA
ncbi:MFS transporter [Arthrobacter sp. U41]|nr:MFS transporter [Arthrobacter sp. U41]